MIDKLKHHWNVSSRREFFTRAGSGLAGMALASMLAETGYAGPQRSARSAACRRNRTISRLAKSVILLFMEGGPSHVDLFDPKPLLTKLDGKPDPRFDRQAVADLARNGAQHPDGVPPHSGSSTGKAACGCPTGTPTSPNTWTI